MPVRSEGDRLVRAVICTPGDEYLGVTDTAAHHIGTVADRDETLRQYGALKAALETFGCEVIDLHELSGHPNSVFTRDTAVCSHSGFVQVRMGLATRRGEEEWMAACLASHGVRCSGGIAAPGTVEGGDVILAGDVAFIGRSGRTNEEGIRQMAEILRGEGREVRVAAVPVPFLHIGGAMSLVAPRRVLACRGVFPEGFFRGFDTLEIECGHYTSGNVICLGDGEIIADAVNSGAIAALESYKLTVHHLDLGEFSKGLGGPTCLILPAERVPSR
ncbi:MAG TPA: arginine deiminase family protein [Patescibacteria group bacterium]|nr:arginine deiminase family protein [Patescibacteria group bacterium]